MSETKVRLVATSGEISKRARAARDRDGDRLILVPVDFSAHSRAALLYACELANSLPATVMVLHVVHDPGEMPGYYSKLIKKKRAGRIQDTAAQVFAEFIEDITESHPDLAPLVKAEPIMVVGLPVTRILEVVDAADPFMVVVGSQGRTGLKHVLIGSKASQIVQLCPVPITVVKAKKVKAKKRNDD
jgi:nucleotide-binding universal stress UspA family protein